MPVHVIDLTDDECALIVRVQRTRGLPTEQAAVEWLVKARLRRAARHATGRGRALYLVRHPGNTRDST